MHRATTLAPPAGCRGTSWWCWSRRGGGSREPWWRGGHRGHWPVVSRPLGCCPEPPVQHRKRGGRPGRSSSSSRRCQGSAAARSLQGLFADRRDRCRRRHRRARRRCRVAQLEVRAEILLDLSHLLQPRRVLRRQTRGAWRLCSEGRRCGASLACPGGDLRARGRAGERRLVGVLPGCRRGRRPGLPCAAQEALPWGTGRRLGAAAHRCHCRCCCCAGGGLLPLLPRDLDQVAGGDEGLARSAESQALACRERHDPSRRGQGLVSGEVLGPGGRGSHQKEASLG